MVNYGFAKDNLFIRQRSVPILGFFLSGEPISEVVCEKGATLQAHG